ncbi:MAG: acetolactate decarboxylase [Candidatus Omnitrophota bacterium]
MKRIFLSISLLTALVFCGCAAVTHDTITQTSTIDALLAGAYDGSMTCAELLKNGDLGIGTFNRLDGEMIILDGEIFQVKADGFIYEPARSTRTPFASVCYFKPDNCFSIQAESDYNAVQKKIDEAVPNKNVFCAVKIHGKFTSMKTRSVPAQTKPYPPLTEVTKNQPVFNFENVEGTIVGFRCPEFVKGVNVPGYHFHFINDNFTKGGHVLDFVLSEGTCQTDICDRYLLILPKGGEGLENIDLSKDRSEELQAVEK